MYYENKAEPPMGVILLISALVTVVFIAAIRFSGLIKHQDKEVHDKPLVFRTDLTDTEATITGNIATDTITFYDKGVVVGSASWDENGKIKFEGDVEQIARICVEDVRRRAESP